MGSTKLYVLLTAWLDAPPRRTADLGDLGDLGLCLLGFLREHARHLPAFAAAGEVTLPLTLTLTLILTLTLTLALTLALTLTLAITLALALTLTLTLTPSPNPNPKVEADLSAVRVADCRAAFREAAAALEARGF